MASNWGLAVRALKSRNYRLFFGGQSISLIGTWMTRIATSWLVYRLTGFGGAAGRGRDSPARFPPFFSRPSRACGSTAGTAIARWLVTQALSMMQSFALAALALSRHIKIW